MTEPRDLDKRVRGVEVRVQGASEKTHGGDKESLLSINHEEECCNLQACRKPA